jgi:hypothetical protein
MEFDLLKFGILSVACIGGFMTTSYYAIANQKGWPAGLMFVNDGSRMSYLIVAGIICQYGSVIISFFVNPWWTALLVLLIGFIGCMILTSMLRVLQSNRFSASRACFNGFNSRICF